MRFPKIALLEDVIDNVDELIFDVRGSEDPDTSEIGCSIEEAVDLPNDIVNI